MRIVAQIPHPSFRISIYALNDKYMLEIEAGPMKQTFKFDQSIGGVEGIKAVLDETFLDQIHDTFNQMFLNFKGAKDRNA